MPDDECPHGLDPSWCTFCKKRAAGEPPAGVRRPPSRVAAPRRAAARPAPARPVSQGAVVGLAKLRKVLFHASAYGSWPSIKELGLLTPAQLLSDAGEARLKVVRDANIDYVHSSGPRITIRDQRPMARAGIDAHLDGISLDEWLAVLNERTFFFARQKELTTLLARYQGTEGQDVVVVDTAKLLAAAKDRVEVAAVSSGEPVPWIRCPCRNRATFEPIDRYRGPLAEIQEVTVTGGVERVADLVVRVVRYHPDRTTEVLVA